MDINQAGVRIEHHGANTIKEAWWECTSVAHVGHDTLCRIDNSSMTPEIQIDGM